MSNGEVVAGIAAGVAAAVVYGCGPVAQAVVARRAPETTGVGLALTLQLARQPIWLAGLLAEVGGFVLEAFAFSSAPATLVAPLLACDMLVFVVLSSIVFREKLSAKGIQGAAAMGCGVALLAVAFGGVAELGGTASDSELLSFLGGAAAFGGLAVLLGNRLERAHRHILAGVAVSTGAGIAYGLAALATRQIGRTFDSSAPWEILSTPAPYVLAGCSVLGIALMQRGLQMSATLAFPITSAVSAFIPVLLGAVVLDDEVPGGGRRLLFVLALVLLIGGISLLAEDRSAAEKGVSRSSD